MTEPMEGTSGSSGERESTATQVQERVQESAQQAAGQAREKAGEVGQRARQTVDERSTQAGDGVSSLAQAMRKTSEELRSQGQDGQARANDRAADLFERLGNYMKEADADRMLRDVEAFGRRRPWALALGGAAVGLVASRFLKASSSRRYQSDVAEAGSWPAPPRSGYYESVGAGSSTSGATTTGS